MLLSTSNVNLATSASISVISGSIEDGLGLSGAIDDNINSYVGFSQNTNNIIQFDFGSTILPSSLSSIKFWQYFDDGRSYYNVQLQISNDATNWFNIYGPSTTAFTSSGIIVPLYSLCTL